MKISLEKQILVRKMIENIDNQTKKCLSSLLQRIIEEHGAESSSIIPVLLSSILFHLKIMMDETIDVNPDVKEAFPKFVIEFMDSFKENIGKFIKDNDI